MSESRPPPMLHFDDGSRIMTEGAASSTRSNATNDVQHHQRQQYGRGSAPIETYYEIERVAKEVVEKLDWTAASRSSTSTSSRGRLLRRVQNIIMSSPEKAEGKSVNTNEDKVVVPNQRTSPTEISSSSGGGDDDNDGFLCRIALQFPDELLNDASQVCWLMEEAISKVYKQKLMGPLEQQLPDYNAAANSSSQEAEKEATEAVGDEIQKLRQEIIQHVNQPPLVFILGDTTYGSCCPDEVSAQHLNAQVLVHYGYACLATPTENVPVVYCFGVSDLTLLTSSVEGQGEGEETKGEGDSVVVVDTNKSVWKECVEKVVEEVNKDESTSKMEELSMEDATNNAGKQQHQHQPKRKILLLYEVKYHHAMKDLQSALEGSGSVSVVMGSIPKQQLSMKRYQPSRVCGGGGCGSSSGGGVGGSCEGGGGCGNTTGGAADSKPEGCCKSGNSSNNKNDGDKPSNEACCESSNTCCAFDNATSTDTINEEESAQQFYIPRTIGGLEIPNDLDLPQYTLLYIGDDLDIDSNNSNAHTRLLHILLRCNSSDGTPSLWSYSPVHRQFITDLLNSSLSPSNSTSLSTVLSRALRRRYYLIQRAKLSTTIAILIGTTSNSYSFRRLLSRTRHRIQSTGRTAYTFAVGKLASSSSKLANFAEIDCFVLIACGETIAKFWKMEREEMLVPVITPMELDVALGIRDWDGRYSCDFGDLIRWDEEDGVEDEYDDIEGNFVFNSKQKRKEKEDGQDEEDDGDSSGDDEPFFSMISGKYEQSKASLTAKQTGVESDLQALPGQGQLMEYKSEAAEFLKKREYRGLEANVGQTEAKAAVLGKVGIASDYGENR